MVQNAAQAGARRVDVRLREVEGVVEVVVEDDGQGIQAEDLGRIGEPFFTTKAAGTGLGVAIARQIVEDHDGRMVLERRPEGGTRVVVRLPRERARAEGS